MQFVTKSSTVISAVAWCLQIQGYLEQLASSGITVGQINLSLPRDIHYAVISNKSTLAKHFSFLNMEPNIHITANNLPSSAAGIKVSFSLDAVPPNSRQYYEILKNSPIPDCVPKLKIPPQFWSTKTAWEYSQRGELNVYRKNAEEKYLEWCKENNQEPEYIIQQGVGGDCNSKKAEGRWW